MTTSSPQSSDGATHQETPSTNLTTFSPETVGTVNSSIVPHLHFKLSITTDKPTSAQAVVANKSDDIFLVNPSASNAVKPLSPIAKAFTPGGSVASATGAGVSSTYIAGGKVGTGPGADDGATGVNSLLAGSVPDDLDARLTNARIWYPKEHAAKLVADLEKMAIDRGADPESMLLHTITLREGIFSTDDHRGRCVLICGIPTSLQESAIPRLIAKHRFPSIIGLHLRDLKTHGVVIVGFSNVRDADGLEQFVLNAQPTWTTRRISPKQYARQTFPGPNDMVTDYEAQLIVTLFYNGNEKFVYAHSAIMTVKQSLMNFGSVKAIHTLPASQQHARNFRVEYDCTRSALSALASLNHAQVYPYVLQVELYRPDAPIPGTQEYALAGLPGGAPFAPHSGIRQNPMPQVLSVTGRSMMPMSHQHSYGNRNNTYSTVSHRRRGDRCGGHGGHNQVDIDRIEFGLDVRTTVMLRNIPNKMDSTMLKAIIDETSCGAYDFMYLRIDFANNCNVGYAFINFIDALAIIPFAMRRAGQRWDHFGSDKVAEISYATIQGRDCLVQKFRNSSVMLEHPSFRPKLFYTGPGPEGGAEEPFPGPDNMSKMRRSVENAEQLGLFVPNTLDLPSTYPYGQRTVVPTQPRLTHHQQVRGGRYMAMAPARVGSLREEEYGRVVDQTMARPSIHSSTTQVQPHQALPVILTPSTPTASLATYAQTPQAYTPCPMRCVDTSRLDDPFAGSTVRRQHNQPAQSNSLFAPRQGQAFREEQRRRRSQFDRGTPGAEYEAYNNRLADPALSPIHPPYTPGSTVYGSNLGSSTGPVCPPYTPGSTVNGSNLGSFTGHVYGPPPAFPNHGYY